MWSLPSEYEYKKIQAATTTTTAYETEAYKMRPQNNPLQDRAHISFLYVLLTFREDQSRKLR